MYAPALWDSDYERFSMIFKLISTSAYYSLAASALDHSLFESLDYCESFGESDGGGVPHPSKKITPLVPFELCLVPAFEFFSA
jgi:hypothetical protein